MVIAAPDHAGEIRRCVRSIAEASRMKDSALEAFIHEISHQRLDVALVAASAHTRKYHAHLALPFVRRQIVVLRFGPVDRELSAIISL